MEPELVMIGHIINETIQYPDRTITPVLGSPAAYSSVIASRLGIKTGLVAKIGKDWPDELLGALKNAKVDMGGVKVAEKSTRNLLIYDKSGNKKVHYLDKAPSIHISDIPRGYLKAKLIYICPMDFEIPLQTVKELRTLGKELAVDLMGYGGATSSIHPDKEEQQSHRTLKKLVNYFHIVRASMEDCEYFFGKVEEKEEEIACLFLEWGADLAIVTQGEKGALVATKDRKFRVPAFPAEVKDCTGAGDAYSAGFLVEYLRTKDPYQSALFAAAAASLVIEGTGGVLAKRMPTTSKVRRRISRAVHEGQIGHKGN